MVYLNLPLGLRRFPFGGNAQTSTMQSTSPRIGSAFFVLITRQMFFTAISSAVFEI